MGVVQPILKVMPCVLKEVGAKDSCQVLDLRALDIPSQVMQHSGKSPNFI